MPKFYTRSGDDGTTGVLGSGRLPKHHPLAEAIGTIDEASAALGAARAICREARTGALLLAAQRDLYRLMAELAATPENAAKFRVIDEARVSWLEENIDALGEAIDPPGEFVLPGDSTAGAALSLARTVVRRAERRLAALWHDRQFENRHLLAYLNRLSSLCFVLELLEDRAAGTAAPTLAKE